MYVFILNICFAITWLLTNNIYSYKLLHLKGTLEISHLTFSEYR